MNLGLYIAKILRKQNAATFTAQVSKIATLAVFLSVFVILTSFGVLLGFKKEIRDKVAGYAGHILVKKYNLNQGVDNELFEIDKGVLKKLRQLPAVKQIYPTIQKPTIIQSDSVIEGIILKGVPADFDFSFFKKYLKKGHIPSYTDSTDSYEILISAFTANLLKLDTQDKVEMYIIEAGDVKKRKPKIVGIFDTGLQEFDKQFGVCDLRMLQRAITTDYTTCSGYEILLTDFDKMDKSQLQISEEIGYQFQAKSVKETYFSMFQWLKIVDTNVLIIVFLMLAVAGINVVTMLLIMVIDRIRMIGILKSMGAQNTQISSIFKWQGMYILAIGLILGNTVGLGLGYLQRTYKLMKLSAETYYMDAVPFHLPWSYILIINFGFILVTFLFIILPVLLVSKIKPTEILRFS